MTPREIADLILRLGSDDVTVQAAVKNYQLSVHLTADGKYGPLTRAALVSAGIPDAPAPFYKPAAPTVDSPGAISKEQAVLDAAAALDAAWLEHGFPPLGDAMRAMLLGHSFGESQFGRHIPGFKDTLRGTNNWGSVQATQKWMQAHGGNDYFGAAAHLDHRGDGTPYVGYYRIYPNQYEAAKGWLSTVLYSPAEFATSIAQGPAAYSQYLRAHGYFEAPVERYTTMLTNGQADMWRTLQAARGRGLKPADPKQAGFGEAPVAPLIERLHTPKGEYSPSAWGTVSMDQFAATKADGEGVRWFGKPLPAPPAPTSASATPAQGSAPAATPAGSPPATSPATTAAASPTPATSPSPSPAPTGASDSAGAAPVHHSHSLAPFIAVGAAVGIVALVTEWLLHRDVAQGSR
ncbi:MAG: peptidoglycan-binding domain-containing protein [Polyangiaceae bacterium]